MYNLIYILSGVILGLVIGYFLWRKKTTTSNIETGIMTERIEEKQENMTKLKEFISQKTDRITNDEVQAFLKISDATAERYLNEIEKEGLIKQMGKTGKYTYYEKV